MPERAGRTGARHGTVRSHAAGTEVVAALRRTGRALQPAAPLDRRDRSARQRIRRPAVRRSGANVAKTEIRSRMYVAGVEGHRSPGNRPCRREGRKPPAGCTGPQFGRSLRACHQDPVPPGGAFSRTRHASSRGHPCTLTLPCCLPPVTHFRRPAPEVAGWRKATREMSE